MKYYTKLELRYTTHGEIDENWYFDNDKNIIIKYINGKRI